jgi:glycosyltransferase involved in cell wall biosynthesis
MSSRVGRSYSMKVLVLSSCDPMDLTSGIGLIVNNSIRYLRDICDEVRGVFIFEAGNAQPTPYRQGRLSGLDGFTTIEAGPRWHPRVEALRALTRLGLHQSEKEFVLEAGRQSDDCDLAIWFGHSWDPLSLRLTNICRCRLILHVNDSITLKRQQCAHGLPGQIQIALARFQESAMISRLRQGRVAIVYVAEPDRKCALELAGVASTSQIFCLPLAVDTEVFTPALTRACETEAPVLLFTGNMGFEPNVVTADNLVRKILPLLPQPLQLRLAGRNSRESLIRLADVDSRVHVTGEVDDIVAEYQRADIFVAAMPPSAGMKNKILEAMACGLPVVASPQACSGLPDTTPGILVGRTDEEIASLISGLLADENLRRQTGAEGRNYVLRHHDWAARTRRLIDFLGSSQRP